MKRMDEDRMKASLTKVLQVWLLEGRDDYDGMPYVGEDLAETMATAALAVVRGIADAQLYLRANDMLNDDD